MSVSEDRTVQPSAPAIPLSGIADPAPLGLALWVKLVKLPALAAARPATLAATVTALNHDVGWILLAFFIFNTYMLVMATQLNLAVFGVFLTLGATEIVLAIGQFNAFA